jgi:hypothetical protein
MKLLNKNIVVRFINEHNSTIGTGINGSPIVRAELWLNTEAEVADEPSRFDENVNYLETNPQICVVVHPNAYCEYRAGDKLFVHYMAWEWREKVDDGYVIETDYVFFKILPDDTFEMVKDNYLGTPIYTKDEEVGGFVIAGEKKDNLQVDITHIPTESMFTIGERVISIDKNNYEFDYWGKRFIRLVKDEIVANYEHEAS